MEAKRLKGELGNESRRLTAKTAAASGRLTDHQVEACSPILNIEICQCAAANEMFCRPNTFVEGEGEHLGGGEAIANQAFHLVASERLVAVTGEAHQLRIGIPTFQGWEGFGGMWAQRDVLAHEDCLMSAD